MEGPAPVKPRQARAWCARGGAGALGREDRGRRVEVVGLRSGGCEVRWEVQRLDRDQIPQSLMGQCKDLGCVM